VRPGTALEALTLIIAVVAVAALPAGAQTVQTLSLSLEFQVEAPLPPGFIPVSIAINGGDGVAVAGVDAEGRPALLYYSLDGVLQWSLPLDGIEPVSVFVSDGYIHAVTRLRDGVTEIVKYYRVNVEGEVVQEYTHVVGDAALIYYAARTPLGVLLVGAKHGGATGWDPLATTIIPGTGTAWTFETVHPGDQEPVKPLVKGDGSACILYATRDSQESIYVCLDVATGEQLQIETLNLEGSTAPPILVPPGGCVAYPANEGIAVVQPGGAAETLPAGQPAPERLTVAAALNVSGYTVSALLGVAEGRPWAGLGVANASGCPAGGLVAGPIGPQGLLPTAANAEGATLAVALASAEGAPVLAVGTVNVEAVQEQVDGGAAPQDGGGEAAGGGLQGVLASPALTAALLIALLAVTALLAVWRRRGAVAGGGG